MLLAVRAQAVSIRWITTRNFDLLLYIGACLSSYAIVFLNVSLGVSALLLAWFWIVSVDGPHVFGTISRTYLDREEWKQRRSLLLGSLLWFLPGPLLLAASLASGTPVPFFVFLVLAQLWAYWHVVRQHYGFLSLYQKKNGEPAGKANAWDYWIFYLLMLLPFVSFLLRHPAARHQLGLGPELSGQERWIVSGLHLAIVASLAAYAAKEVAVVRSGRPWNFPKNLYLLAVIPLHLLVFLHPYISTHAPIILFAVFVTFYHNIQYHGIVWYYNRNRYGSDPDGKRFGWASLVSRNFFTYYAAAIVFTLAYRYTNWFFAGLPVPLGTGPNAVSQFKLGSLFQVSDLAIGFWWGFAFNHYYLDQKIWRISKDRQLTQDLRI